MATTPEQNQAIIEMRVQIQGMLDALNQLAREVGADPIPMPTIPQPPITPLHPFFLRPQNS